MAIYNLQGATLTNVFLSANSTVPTVFTGPLSANAGSSFHRLLGSLVTGENTNVASGINSRASGIRSTASAEAAVADGTDCSAVGIGSIAQNIYTFAGGNMSHAQNYGTCAAGAYSHAGGYECIAANDNSFAHGYRNNTGKRVAFLSYNNATKTLTFSPSLTANFSYVSPGTTIGIFDSGLFGNIFGIVQSRNATTGTITFTTDIWGGNGATPGYAIAQISGVDNSAFAIGLENQAYGQASFAGGGNSIASGIASFVYGDGCTADGLVSTALGQYARTGYDYSYIWNSSLDFVSASRVGQYMLSATGGVFSPGNVSVGSDRTQEVRFNVTGPSILGNTGCTSIGSFSIATGINTRSTGNAALTIGAGTSATGPTSFSGGVNNRAEGNNAVAFGNLTRATGTGSFTHGLGTSATNSYSVAFGTNSIASNTNAFAFGQEAKASGASSFALGAYGTASGTGSIALGDTVEAIGDQSLATGIGTIARGAVSFTTGDSCSAAGYCSQAHGFGAAVQHDYSYMWSDGSGGSIAYGVRTTKTNQFAISATGGVYIPGKVGIGTDSTANELTVNGTVSASTAVVAGAFVPGANFINAQTGTFYALTNSDNGRAITLNNSSPITVGVPSGLPVGFNVVLVQIGTGQVSLSAGTGVTINSDGGKTKIASQYSSASLLEYANNVLNFSGNITT